MADAGGLADMSKFVIVRDFQFCGRSDTLQRPLSAFQIFKEQRRSSPERCRRHYSTALVILSKNIAPQICGESNAGEVAFVLLGVLCGWSRNGLLWLFATCCAKLKGPPAILSSGPVAQRLEQQTHNLLVVGSNPTGPTKTIEPQTDSLGNSANTSGYRTLWNSCIVLTQVCESSSYS
jgi:hypothetical protein